MNNKLLVILGLLCTVILVSSIFLSVSTGQFQWDPWLGPKGGFIQSTSTEVNGFITTNTTWSLVESPYVVTGTVYIEPYVFLTIEPGVEVKFVSGTSLVVFGGLFVEGNETHEILFTANTTTPSPGYWGGVRYRGSHLTMNFVSVEFATKGLDLWEIAAISQSSITNCTTAIEGKLNYADNLTVTHNSEDGLNLTYSLLTIIHNSEISENGGNGINSIGNSTITIDDCTIRNNTRNGLFLTNGGSIINSRITGNGHNGTYTHGFTVIENSTFSDNNGNGIWAEYSVEVIDCRVDGNGENGLRFNHLEGESSIENSTIYANNADGIWTAMTSTIRSSEITQNNGNGVSGNLISNGFTFRIVESNVSNNGLTGLTCPLNYTIGQISMNVSKSFITNNNMSGISGCGYAYNTTISSNKNSGVLGNFTIDRYSFITSNQGSGFNGTGIIYWSTIYGNTPYDVIATIFPYNITAIENWWGTTNGSEIVEHIWDHNDDMSLGYVFHDPWRLVQIQPQDDVAPEINLIVWERTNPGRYIPDPASLPEPFARSAEAVNVFAEVIDNSSPIPSGVDEVLLIYSIDHGELWNTTMVYNGTSSLWKATIPGYVISWPGNVTVEFFVRVYDKAGNERSSNIITFLILAMPPGDITGDGYTGIDDIVSAAEFFGKDWRFP